MVHPTPNRLIGHRHAAFRQQIFDVAQAEGEPEVEPYRLVNDLRRETIPAVADFLHPLGYSATGRTASPTRRDNAPPPYSAPPIPGGGEDSKKPPCAPPEGLPTGASNPAQGGVTYRTD